MKKLFVLLTAMFCFALLTTAQDKPAETKDGKTVFTAAKCQNCHAVSTESITTKGKAPDLAGVGNKHNLDFMKKYLKKEEALHDKKHPVAFKGEDAEYDILVKWLSELKTAPKE